LGRRAAEEGDLDVAAAVALGSARANRLSINNQLALHEGHQIGPGFATGI